MIQAIVTLLGGWRATAFAALALCAILWGSAEHWRVGHAKAETKALRDAQAAQETAYAKAAQDAEAKARATERYSAAAIARAVDDYERGKSDAQVDADRLLSDLRAGTVRLRRELAACSADRVPGTPAGPGEPYGSAELRAAVAQSVAVGHACDARVIALQSILTAERRK